MTNLQDSRNLFVVELVDEDLLDRQYPQHKGKMGGSAIDVKEYLYDESIDVSGKSLVIDWYYKVHRADGRTVLHYVKFVGGMDEPLFASENDPAYARAGLVRPREVSRRAGRTLPGEGDAGGVRVRGRVQGPAAVHRQPGGEHPGKRPHLHPEAVLRLGQLPG